MDTAEELRHLFPGLNSTPFQVLEAPDPSFNCVAWAMGERGRYWWPDPDIRTYWPHEPRVATVAAVGRVFEEVGYSRCDGADAEPGFEKVAVYAIEVDDPEAEDSIVPTHVARQRPDGLWTSKLGRHALIAHVLSGLEGAMYGRVDRILRRPIPAG